MVDKEHIHVNSIYSKTPKGTCYKQICKRAKKVIIDCDPGGDDAQALILGLYLAKKHDIEILGITCVAGNGTLEHVVKCTQLTMKICGNTEIPIYAGLEPFAKG